MRTGSSSRDAGEIRSGAQLTIHDTEVVFGVRNSNTFPMCYIEEKLLETSSKSSDATPGLYRGLAVMQMEDPS
jgi:hypothetical protein